MAEAPRVHLGKLVADACLLIEDVEVPHPVGDNTFARVYGRLLALIHRTDPARTARPELDHLRTTVLLRLEELRVVLHLREALGHLGAYAEGMDAIEIRATVP